MKTREKQFMDFIASNGIEFRAYTTPDFDSDEDIDDFIEAVVNNEDANLYTEFDEAAGTCYNCFDLADICYDDEEYVADFIESPLSCWINWFEGRADWAVADASVEWREEGGEWKRAYGSSDFSFYDESGEDWFDKMRAAIREEKLAVLGL